MFIVLTSANLVQNLSLVFELGVDGGPNTPMAGYVKIWPKFNA